MARSRPRKTFAKGSPAARKRSEVAEAIHREHPGYSMARKFKIASAAVKRMKRRPM